MSNDALWMSDAMLDSLSLQLRDAESRRAEAERAHQDALAQLRGMSSGVSRVGESYETLQSRARELEKKAALETVRCEELQLEFTSALKSKPSRTSQMQSSSTTSGMLTSTGGFSGSLGQSSKYTTAASSTAISGISGLSSMMANNISNNISGIGAYSSSSVINSTLAKPESSVTWAPTPDHQKSTEIDRIMAKIEQARLSIANDNRILAELEHPRTTGPSHYIMTSSALGTGAGMASSIVSHSQPSNLSNLSTNLTSNYGTGAISISAQSGGGLSSYSSTAVPNLSPLPIRANQINTMPPPLCQSSTMPVLSLHNTYSLPSGSASYTLGLSGAPNASSYTYPSVGQSATAVGLSSMLGGNSGLSGLGGGHSSHLLNSGLGGTTGLNLSSSNPLSGLSGLTSLGLGYNSSSYSTYTNPLISSGAMKLKTLDDFEIGINRYNRGGTPCSPIPTTSWGLDNYTSGGIDGINPAFMHSHSQSRPLSRLGLDGLDGRSHGLTLNGSGEPQVDMLDIPGKGRCCVFIARFSYDPPDVEGSEGELALCAGDYLLVWGNGEPQGGYLDAELLDGRRGLVPASFVQRLVGDDLLEFHQAVVSTLRDADDVPIPLDPAPMIQHNNIPHSIMMQHANDDLGRISDVVHTDQDPEDDLDPVPAPRHLTLERQLNKSVLIGWNPPDQYGNHMIESYHVYVDGNIKVTIKALERTRALVEGVDSNRPHRISVRSVTQNRRTSRDAACTMVIGRDVSHLGPTAVKANNITCSSAVISWLPANSNHQHVVCVNNVEVRTLKPGVYRHTITGLSPSTQYRVTVRAKQLRAPGQQQPPPVGPPPEEAPGAYTDFRTLAKGLPDPPQEIQVEPGPQDGTLLVTWQPVSRPPASGPVTGYAVYADGKKVTDVDSPTGDHALIDITKLVGINPQAVTVRTKSRDAQSADSLATPIPNVVKNAARMRQNQKQTQQLPQNPQQQMQQQQQMHQQQQQQQQMHQQKMMGGPNVPKPGDKNLNNMQNSMLPGQQKQPNQMMQGGMQNMQGGIQNMQGGMQNMQGGMQNMQGGMQNNQSGMNQNMTGMQNQNIQGSMQPSMQPGMQTNMQSGMQPGMQGRPRPQGPNQMQQNRMPMSTGQPGQRGPIPSQQQQQQRKLRHFLAMFDYDPTTMSPNPDSCEEELPFREGDTIKVYGDKDPDGFYWGELRGRRGYVPHNMVQEIEDGAVGHTGPRQPSVRGISRDRWGDIYANMPVRRMVALYDYDPNELSPNIDAEVELSFQTGQTILVYGDMDEDGFFMGELDGIRGLVPSNFLTDADQHNQGGPSAASVAQRSLNNRGRGIGPGARGPPPPPRDNMGMNQRKDNTGHPAPDQQLQGMQGTAGNMLNRNQQQQNMVGGNMNRNQQQQQQQNQLQQNQQQNMMGPNIRNQQQQQMGANTMNNTNNMNNNMNNNTNTNNMNQQQQQQQNNMNNQQQNNMMRPNMQQQNMTGPQQQQQNMMNQNMGGGGPMQQNMMRPNMNQQQTPVTTQQSTGLFSTGLFSGPANAASGAAGSLFGGGNRNMGPQVVPNQNQGQFNNQQGNQQQQIPGQPSMLQKLGDMAATAPGGDMLSKGKELIFMKFGLGGK